MLAKFRWFFTLSCVASFLLIGWYYSFLWSWSKKTLESEFDPHLRSSEFQHLINALRGLHGALLNAHAHSDDISVDALQCVRMTSDQLECLLHNFASIASSKLTIDAARVIRRDMRRIIYLCNRVILKVFAALEAKTSEYQNSFLCNKLGHKEFSIRDLPGQSVEECLQDRDFVHTSDTKQTNNDLSNFNEMKGRCNEKYLEVCSSQTYAVPIGALAQILRYLIENPFLENCD